MASYRVYSILPDGHINRAQDIERDDDDEALAFAMRVLDDAPSVEIWQYARLVRRIDRIPSPRSPA